MRLDKFLASAGLGTRSEVKELVRKGRITVNGSVVRDAGMNVADGDSAAFDGRPIGTEPADIGAKKYFLLNKPAGIVSATTDGRERTVIDLFADEHIKDLFPAGRLDKDTEGLLIVTNDGELSHYLLAPKREVPKEYYAKVRGILTTEHAEMFARGIEFKEFTSKPAKLDIITADAEAGTCEVLITVHEGKFHEVKRLVAAAGCEVMYLRRTGFGPLKLDDTLAAGSYRELGSDEIAALKAAAGRL